MCMGEDEKVNGQSCNFANGARWGTTTLSRSSAVRRWKPHLKRRGRCGRHGLNPCPQKVEENMYKIIIIYCNFIINFRASLFPPSFACLEGQELVFYINSRPSKHFSGDPRWSALHPRSVFACHHACQHFVSTFEIFRFCRFLKWWQAGEFGTELRYHLKRAVTLLQNS